MSVTLLILGCIGLGASLWIRHQDNKRSRDQEFRQYELNEFRRED